MVLRADYKASWVAAAGENRNGDAVAVWLQTNTVPDKVYAATRNAGSVTFGSAAGLSGRSAFNPYPLLARDDPFGNDFVVWQDQGAVYATVRAAGATKWPGGQARRLESLLLLDLGNCDCDYEHELRQAGRPPYKLLRLCLASRGCRRIFTLCVPLIARSS